MQMGNTVQEEIFVEMVDHLLYFLFQNILLPVTCGTNSDCSTVPGRNVCKQEKDEEKSCQPPSECLCSDKEFCTMDDKCFRPGKKITEKFVFSFISSHMFC